MRQFILLILFACSFYITKAQDILIEIKAGKHTMKNAPVHVRLPKPLSSNIKYLINQKNGKVVRAQLDSTTLVFIPKDPIPTGKSVVYALKANLRGQDFQYLPQIRVEEQQNGLLVKLEAPNTKARPIFFYHTKEAMPPADSPEYYRRSGFIHPLYSPDGNILTDDFPAGHMHQHGIFMTWVNTTFRGQAVDFWNQHAQKGTVEHVEVMEIKEGPVFTRIKTRLRHISLAHGPVLEEIWTFTIYPISDHFLFDLESEQVNITTDTLFLNQYHYGGLAFRGSKQWNKHDSLNFRNNWQILTSEGKDNASANHTHARWVDASGKLNKGVSGLTIFGHPSNFKYPQAIRVHPNMPYWCYAPVVDEALTLPPGKPYKSCFRFYVHSGGAHVEGIEKEWMNYIQPVDLKIIGK